MCGCTSDKADYLAQSSTNVSTSKDSSGQFSVETEILLTRPDARVEPGPLGGLQDEASLETNGILPWGPVQAVHTVTIGGNEYILNQLSSPDPFTATYQMPDGTIVTTNEPFDEVILFDGDEGPQPDTVEWVSEYGDAWEVVPNRMTVYFDETATEQEIAQLIDTEDLHVVMSWFEPIADVMELGMSGSEYQTTGGEAKQTSELSGESSTGTAGGGTVPGEMLLGGGISGNAIAWFDFEFDRARFATVSAAHTYFQALPKVKACLPMIIDYAVNHYDTPNDPYYSNPHQDDHSLWIDAFDLEGYDEIPLTPYPGRPQYVAVIDSGVYRFHEDMKVSILGVNVYSRRIESPSIWGGMPNFPVNNPRWAPDQPSRNKYWHRLYGHGTHVAAMVNAKTNNARGVPSMAPTVNILPIRMKFWTKTYNAPFLTVPDEPTISINSPVKAIRALRFHLKHDQWWFNVRVVNMSFGWPADARNLPWPPNFLSGGFGLNLNRDLAKNDRLYVASSGNEGRNAKIYPAAYSNVLGVTGLNLDLRYTNPYLRYTRNMESNHRYDDTYPVSGFFNIIEPDDSTYLPVPPEDDPTYSPYTVSAEYLPFSGTSAAAPQVSALAYHLYSRRPELSGGNSTNFIEVRDHIINTRFYQMDPLLTPLKGPISYFQALETW